MAKVPLRILMTADAVGGVWTYALDLVSGLADHGIEVVLAVMGPPPDDDGRAEAARLAKLTVVEGDYRLEWMPDAADDVARAGTWLQELAAAHRPDLVHVNGYAHAALSWEVPVLVAAHSCVCTWWRAVHGEPPPPEWDAYARAVATGLRAADMIVAPTQAFLAQLAAIHGPIASSRVIHNGRAADGVAPAEKERLILSAGRIWDAAKNVASLAAVAPHLQAPVMVAGDGAGPGAATGTGANLRFLGHLNQGAMRSAYARAAIFALPARYEPFGLAVLEAAQSGCALVLGDIPTLRELWEGAAVFVPPDDTAALQDALEVLLREPETTAALGAAARRRAADYGRDRMAAAYVRAYSQLLSARPSRRAGRPGDPRPAATVPVAL